MDTYKVRIYLIIFFFQIHPHQRPITIHRVADAKIRAHFNLSDMGDFRPDFFSSDFVGSPRAIKFSKQKTAKKVRICGKKGKSDDREKKTSYVFFFSSNITNDSIINDIYYQQQDEEVSQFDVKN